MIGIGSVDAHRPPNHNEFMRSVWRVVAGMALLCWILLAGFNLDLWLHVVADHSATEERHTHEADSADHHESNHHQSDHGDEAPNHSHELTNLDVSVATRTSVMAPTQLPLADMASPVWRLSVNRGFAIHLPPPRPPTTASLERHPILLI